LYGAAGPVMIQDFPACREPVASGFRGSIQLQERVWPVAAEGKVAARSVGRNGGCAAASGTARNSPGAAPAPTRLAPSGRPGRRPRLRRSSRSRSTPGAARATPSAPAAPLPAPAAAQWIRLLLRSPPFRIAIRAEPTVIDPRQAPSMLPTSPANPALTPVSSPRPIPGALARRDPPIRLRPGRRRATPRFGSDGTNPMASWVGHFPRSPKCCFRRSEANGKLGKLLTWRPPAELGRPKPMAPWASLHESRPADCGAPSEANGNLGKIPSLGRRTIGRRAKPMAIWASPRPAQPAFVSGQAKPMAIWGADRRQLDAPVGAAPRAIRVVGRGASPSTAAAGGSMLGPGPRRTCRDRGAGHEVRARSRP